MVEVQPQSAGPANGNNPGHPAKRNDSKTFGQKLGQKSKQIIPSFISIFIIFLGILNIFSILVIVLSLSLKVPLGIFFPVELVEAGSIIHGIIGIALIYMGIQLYQRQRGAWFLIIIFLIISLMASLLAGSVTSLATGISTFIMIGLLYIYRDHFTATSGILSPKRMSALLFIFGMFLYGTVGSMLLGDEFRAPVKTWSDAIYFTATTMTTVGYGDYVPATETAKWFTIGLMVLGFTSFILAVGTIIGPYMEQRLLKVMHMVGGNKTQRMNDHLVICGISTEANIIIDNLRSAKTDYVLLCSASEKHEQMEEEGINVVLGDPTESEDLEKVGIRRAKALLAISNDDAMNAFVTITARRLCPELTIVAMASKSENIQKLNSVGATHVISPSVIGAERLLRAATGQKENVPD